MTQITKAQIILDTLVHYAGNPELRSVGISVLGCKQCKYKGKDDKRCAFARLCTPEGLEALSKKEGTGVSSLKLGPDHYLRPEFHGHDVGFWTQVQMIHDQFINSEGKVNWTDLSAILSEYDLKL